MLSKLAHMFACEINVSPIVVSLKMQFICEHCYIFIFHYIFLHRL